MSERKDFGGGMYRSENINFGVGMERKEWRERKEAKILAVGWR